MNKLFNTQNIFSFFLRRLNDLRRRSRLRWLVADIAWIFAKLNLLINQPASCSAPEELGRTWQHLMPWDNQQDYQMISYNETTAIMKISIRCPLRGSGDKAACDKFMTYDRTLMQKVGGELTVVESQSNSGHDYCILFIKLQKTLR